MTSAAELVPLRVRHTAAIRTMHWVSASLLVGSYATAWTVSFATSNASAARLILLHRSFGVVIFTVTAIRFAWRQRTRMPDLPTDVPKLQRKAARANVVGLYILLVLQPLLGLTASMLHGDHLSLLGGLVMPDLLPIDRKLAHAIFQAHGIVALLLLGLIGMHAAAALYHHFVRRDDVLAGMLPGVERRGGTASPVPLPRG